MAWAFSRDDARPCSKMRRSSRLRFLPVDMFEGKKKRKAFSGAPVHQEMCNLPQSGGAFAIRRQLGNGLDRKFACDLVRAFQPKDGRVSRLLLRDILAGGLAERRG